MGVRTGNGGFLKKKKLSSISSLRASHSLVMIERVLDKYAISYDNGIQTFDTANVIGYFYQNNTTIDADNENQVYSNGLSEVILGRAIKQLNLPRDEIVVMTKVRFMVPVKSGFLF